MLGKNLKISNFFLCRGYHRTICKDFKKSSECAEFPPLLKVLQFKQGPKVN